MLDQDKEIFERLKQKKPVPDVEGAVNKQIEVPDVDNTEHENCIEVGGKLIEIQPTLLKYFRNNAVSFYQVLDTVPLPAIFMMTEDKNGLDGDKAVLTFVSAVLDDPKLAKRIYDQMDAGQLMRLVGIFKRLNGIADKENKSKNVQAARVKE